MKTETKIKHLTKKHCSVPKSNNHTTNVLRPFFWDHPGEPVPQEKSQIKVKIRKPYLYSTLLWAAHL